MSSNKNSRHTPSSSSPIPTNTSKLPKFLQKGNSRDRSKSVNDSGLSAAIIDRAGSSEASSSLHQSPSPSGSKSSKKGSRFLGGKKEKNREEDKPSSEAEDTPIIVEPGEGSPSIPIPRSRARPDHSLSGSSDHSGHLTSQSYTHTTSTSPRMSDLPSRLSGWFSHTFSSSSTDLSLPNLLNTHHASSPKKSGASALLNVAKHGKGHLDKAMRYLLDSDATPDKCTDPIWLLGVQHKGYEPPPPIPPESPGGRRPSVDTKSKFPRSPSRSSTASKHSQSHSLSQSQPPSARDSPAPSPSTSLSASVSSSVSAASTTPTPSAVSPSNVKHPGANWPEEFYSDFTSKVWVTYRSQFTPIRDTSLNDLPSPCDPLTSSTMSYVDTFKSDSSYSVRSIASSNYVAPASPSNTGKKWNWGLPGLGGEKGWTSDAGWGCMLRTGQSLLANALIFMWLGREWRRPDVPMFTESYARYIQIVSWFLDTPSPEAPFSVHRMALAGKDLGKDVGQWFGPSTAAGAIKTLVHAFPQSGLGVAVATDGALYQTDVFAASHSATTAPTSSRGSTFSSPSLGRRRHNHTTTSWGDRPVLLLLGIRLGIDGVNPIYYDTIKMLYQFPQSVGIAGGRPSSSYYFVGSQSDNLFYLDPHHARPTVPLRSPPSGDAPTFRDTANRTPESDLARDKDRSKAEKKGRTSGISPRGGSVKRVVTPTSPSSVKTTGSSTFSYHAPTSPSPLQQEYASAHAASGSNSRKESKKREQNALDEAGSLSQPPSRTESPVLITPSTSTETGNMSDMDYSEIAGEARGGASGLTPLQEHFISAYSLAELKTFHCERVRKMPLSGLDPSMLIGFLCKDETDWLDLRRRVGELPRTIFSIQDEPPSWSNDSDDNMGLESISDPEDLAADMDMDDDTDDDLVKDADNDRDDDDEDEEEEKFYDTRSISSRSARGEERGRSEEVDTEEDPVDPITPGPNTTKFNVPNVDNQGSPADSDDIEDDWVDPSIPTSPMLTPQPTYQSEIPNQAGIPAVVPRLAKSKSNGSTGSGKKKKGKKDQQVPVPVPKIKVPTPPSKESFPFPVANASDDGTDWSASSSSSGGIQTQGIEKRMHNARARDGGRTQSGGVKGILMDDWTDPQSDRG